MNVCSHTKQGKIKNILKKMTKKISPRGDDPSKNIFSSILKIHSEQYNCRLI